MQLATTSNADETRGGEIQASSIAQDETDDDGQIIAAVTAGTVRLRPSSEPKESDRNKYRDVRQSVIERIWVCGAQPEAARRVPSGNLK
jgi:hypothetical protein